MSQKRLLWSALGGLACTVTLALPALAQLQIATDEPVQAMLIARTETGANANMPLVSEELGVTIDGQHATTRLKQVYHNRSNGRVEGQYRLQAGSGARVVGFAYWNGEQKIVGEVFEKQTARRIYNSVTRRNRDPGLLEEIGDGIFSFKIFPIQPNEKKRVQIEYSDWIERRGDVVRYRAPVGHQSANITVTLRDAGPIASVRSPTHKVHVDKLRSGDVRVQVASARGQHKEFVLTYKVKDRPWTARAFVHKDKQHDGYFALALPAPPMPASAVAPKDVTLVLDRSGSMAGAPLTQAKTAAANVVRRLGKQDRVNVISFDDEVYPLFESPKLANAQVRERAISFINRLSDGGGTDLALALNSALGSQDTGKRPRVILFLTDGQSDSRSTLEAARADRNDARIFTVGMGQGVNKPLLSRLSAEKRGRFTYIARAKDIERDVGTLYRQISRPLLVDVSLSTTGVRALRKYPRSLPDIFVEDELVITGRLVGTGPVTFTIKGMLDGKPVQYTARAQVRPVVDRPWVGKLWAQSRVDHILEELALTGHNQELQNEVIELALAYNFVTKYTSFLAIPESELTGEARNMMLTARQRKSKIMARKADAAALADKNKRGHIRGNSGGNTIAAKPRVSSGPRPTSSAPMQPPADTMRPSPPPGQPSGKNYDFENDEVEGQLVRPDGEMVDTRSFATTPTSTSHRRTGGGDSKPDATYRRAPASPPPGSGGCAGCASGSGTGGLWLAILIALALGRRRMHTAIR